MASAAAIISTAKAAAAGTAPAHVSGFASLATVDWAADLQVLLRTYSEYWYVTLGCCAGWLAVHFLFALIFSRTNVVASIVGHLRDADLAKGRTAKPDKKYFYRARYDLYSKATAFVHAVLTSYFAIQAFASFNPIDDLAVPVIYTNVPYYNIITQISAGYFLYDFLIAVYDFDLPYIAHGLFSAVIYAHAVYPFCAQIGVIYLIYEVSTIFVHIRWFLINTGRAKSLFFDVSQYGFIVCFLLIRMGFGVFYSFLYFQPMLWQLFLAIPVVPHSRIAVALFALSNLTLNGLNIMWTKMIIDTVRRAAKASKKGKDGKAAAVKQASTAAVKKID